MTGIHLQAEDLVQIGNTQIIDTFAEAFGMVYTRLIVTAFDEHWLSAATNELCGYGSSVIACDAEVGVERTLPVDQSPDGRPGAAILAFGFSADALGKAIAKRVGQCVMTCASTAVFDGLPTAEKRLPLGKTLRYFGDGFQKSKMIGETRYWRIPVMDGEFFCVESLGIEKGVAGGNIIFQAIDQPTALTAARQAIEALASVPDVIAPFPGGVARSGSKVGSKYKGLMASTSDQNCPTLRGRVDSLVVAGANCVLEIVLDGTSEEAVASGMKAAMNAAAIDGVLAIGAGNYGGKLGKFHFHLKELV
ncbi:formylmethanofuran--tetrahydromethanopterin N-formyltransferase [Blastopirellula marina]|uniref:Formylmethanofuran--tetrahydromethanopterin formyltransferase n=1 Tax=Blastopirellula marina TaxID=124 RepID=A0A2S8G217_9BACT|nr:formylmethanofuran--tetrahydromethanopterin N-formyltransferase [Blastopirellula marina]PQO38350.1 formylmethanofuran--tetrahydromethanopterin N-formyltransferase [Blastopirellula marina]PTL45006.1 formylmethanofuran--tetrahydromethanopterin N-formyltransferase [Blastopirellula marina]